MLLKIRYLSVYLLAIGFALIYISPGLVKLYANFVVLNFLVPAALLVHLSLILFTFFKRRYQFLLVYCFALVPGIHFVKATFAVSPVNFNSPKKQLKVLTYNVKAFSVYKDKNSTLVNDLANWIEYQRFDIVCFQEFFNHPGEANHQSIQRFSKIFPYYSYSPVVVTRSNKIEVTSGLIIFSKFPILDSANFVFRSKNHNMMQFADILVKSDTFRIVNVHLESFQHYLYKEEPTLRNYARTLKINLISKIEQCKVLEDLLKDTPYRTFICGDFNDTPYQYSYNLLKSRYINGFEKAGCGFGFSYSTDLPLVRIDNIFASKSFRFLNFTTFEEINYSDHYPVAATIGYK